MAEFSKDGRKLRPRRHAGGAEPVRSTSEPRREGGYDRHSRPSFDGHARSDRASRPYGERRSYGESRPQGERRSSGAGRSYGEGRPQGERKAYGERRQGEGRAYGERKPFGERRSYGEGRPQGERKAYGERKSYGDRKSFNPDRKAGDRKPYGRKPAPGFNRKSEEGIDRMIASTPKREAPNYEVEDFAGKDVVRLNKFIANSGVCSRREADTMIQAGVVTVNGEVVTELGTKVNIRTDVIKFNGETLRGEARVYLVMNKPKGYVTTASDPHAEKTVMDLLKGCSTRVYPVGRLDKATTGVLMFTNDGEIAERLTHPSFDKKKIYQVILNKPFSEEERQQVLRGITLADGDIAADAIEFIDDDDHRKLGIEIHSGKNRIVRRIFEHFGYDVRGLDRVYFAGLTKKGLKKGEWRYLTEGEVNILKMGAYV